MAAPRGPTSGVRIPVIDGQLKPLGYQQLTSIGTSAAKSMTVPTGSILALVGVADQAVRWRDDGTDPTSSVGFPVAASASFWYPGDLDEFSVIAQTGTAKLDICYYGY